MALSSPTLQIRKTLRRVYVTISILDEAKGNQERLRTSQRVKPGPTESNRQGTSPLLPENRIRVEMRNSSPRRQGAPKAIVQGELNKPVTVMCLPFSPFPNGSIDCSHHAPVPSFYTGIICRRVEDNLPFSFIVLQSKRNHIWTGQCYQLLPRNPRVGARCTCWMGLGVAFLGMEELNMNSVGKEKRRKLSELFIAHIMCLCFLAFPSTLLEDASLYWSWQWDAKPTCGRVV